MWWRASALAFALVLAGGDAATATFAGSNGRLAYFYGAEVFTMRADGTDTRSLGAGLSPAWSPSGRHLAFDAPTNGNYDVWVMRADGRERRRLTTNPAPDYSSSWSPDGTLVVFTSDRGGEDLYVIGADGRGERRLTTDPAPDWGASWSPDGSRIAFAGNARGNLEIEVVAPDGSGRVALTDHPERDYDPAWSPDGTRIAFTSERDGNANVYVMNADGTALQQVTTDPSNDWRPAWSPDGTLIAFESDRDDRVFDRDVFVMNADGSDQRRLRRADENARDVDWQPTIDLSVTLRRSGRRVVTTVANLSPADAQRVVLTITAGRTRIFRLGTLETATNRTMSVAVPKAVRRVVAMVSGWQVDPNTRNNLAALRR